VVRDRGMTLVAVLAVGAALLSGPTTSRRAERKKPRAPFARVRSQLQEAGRGEETLSQESVGRLDAFEEWFYRQRAYPGDAVPKDAIGQAFRAALVRNADTDEADDASSHWVPIGPSTIPNGQTDNSGGGPLSPVSGRVSAIAVDPIHRNIVYAAGAQGGVWKTLNAHAAKPLWVPLTDHEPSLAVGAMAIDPVNPNIIYVGTGEANRSCDSYYGRGILRSTDGGHTWKVLGGGGSPGGNTGPFVGKAIARIAIDPATAGSPESTTLWASTTIGVYTSGTIATCSLPSSGPLGLWRSQDGGETWQMQNVPNPGAGTISVQDFVVDPTNPEVLYVGVRSTGVWKSTNAASGQPAVFTPLTNGFPTGSSGMPLRRINLTIGNSSNPGTVIAAVEDSFGDQIWGLFKTTDGGNTWSHLDNGQNGTASLTAASTAVTRTTGPNFDPAWVGRRFIVNGQYSFTVASVTDMNTLNLNVASPVSLVGAAWSAGTYPTYCDGQCFYDMTVALDPSDPASNRLYVGGNPHGFAADLSGLGAFGHTNWRSDDGGVTWTSVSQGNGVSGGVHTDDHAYAFDSQGRVYDGNDGGIWRSDDHGGSWTSMNTNIAITQFQSVGTHPFDSQFDIGGTQDNGTNIRNSALVAPPGWFHADFGDGGIAFIDQSNPARMFHTYFNQSFNFMGPAKSTDGGVGGPGSWPFVGAYFGYGPQYYNGMDPTEPVSFYAPLTKHPAFSPNVVYFGSNRLYRSPDPQPTLSKAVSWTAVSPALTKGGSAYISWIGVLPNLVGGKEVIYTGASDGRIEVSSSVDGLGVATWTAIDAAPLPNRAVTEIVVDGADPTGNTAYVSFSGFNANTPTTPGHVFVTTNGLSATPTWVDISGDLPDLPMNQVVVDHRKPASVLVGTDIGVFRTRDGIHWRHLSKGLPFVTVFGLEQNAAGDRIVAATHGRGMFALIRP
jgi:hypothetical protein